MATISLCMIVKNEERILSRCLDSYRDTYDELIIVDTGSTDRTKEIAANYTDKIYDFQWIDDFSAARNYAFSKANCEYIFSADADEELDDFNRNKLINLKDAILPEIDIVQMYYVNIGDVNMVYNFEKELRPKLFKRLRTFNWISPIHETVRLEPLVFDSDIEIMHKPENSHSKRDFNTFIKAIKKGERLENYVVIMFCKELFISGTDDDFLEASTVFKNVLMLEERNEECRKNIACVMARIFRLETDSASFFKLVMKEVANEPCAEICMELGMYYYGIEDYEEAIIWFINAASETPSIIDIHSSGDKPLRYLSECYKKLAFFHNNETKDYALANQFMEMSQEYKTMAENWTMPSEC